MQAITGRVSSSLLVTEKKLCERFAFTIKKKEKQEIMSTFFSLLDVCK